MTKKRGFIWSGKAEEAFQKLKKAMVEAPVLQLPDFKKSFTVETYACYYGLRVVLSQEGHPIAYISKALGPKNIGLSVYKKEFLAIILLIDKWRSYLIQGQFTIKTDQHSLKYLLHQKISTPIQ